MTFAFAYYFLASIWVYWWICKTKELWKQPKWVWGQNGLGVNQKPFSHVFGRPIFFLVDQIHFWSTKKNEKYTGQLVDQETDQKYMDAARLDNWLTKRLTKTTWTGLLWTATKAASMYVWSVSWSTICPVYFSFFRSTKKKIGQSQRPDKKNLVSLWFFFGQSLTFLFTL